MMLTEAVEALAARSTVSGDCLIAPTGPSKYAEVHWEGKRLAAHRAVILARGESFRSGEVARHTCDVKGCIRSEHLVRGTQAQNSHDMYERKRRSGKFAKGEQTARAVLTTEIVKTLRRRAAAGESVRTLADEYKVTHGCAWSAVRGRTWPQITEPPPVPRGRAHRPLDERRVENVHADKAARALSLSAQGCSLSEIAQAIGVSRGTTWTLLDRLRRAA